MSKLINNLEWDLMWSIENNIGSHYIQVSIQGEIIGEFDGASLTEAGNITPEQYYVLEQQGECFELEWPLWSWWPG